MIKFNAINLKVTNRAQENKSNQTEPSNTLGYSSSPLRNNLPSGVLGRSMVPFGHSILEKYIDESFFQLKGATPDEYQKEAAEHIMRGEDVLVTAPTGTGKTAIAMFAISKNMNEGKKTFYTTPLKALSNEKFRQLKTVYGEENVGLLTGDIKINPKAPVIVMTTEIYRNMVFGDNFKDKSANLDNLKTVIFDELHYLGDVDRGGIWEQSIILSDKKTQILSLSATIGNNKEMTDWMSKIRGQETHLVNVPSEKRHVPLFFQNVQVSSLKPGQEASATSSKKVAPPNEQSFLKMVHVLKEKDQLPAIFFVFSKKASKNLLSVFQKKGLTLNTKEEVAQIQDIIKKYEDRGTYLGESLDYAALKKGYAIHNSGLLPAQKELVEELFNKKLIKVVIATETLAAGINMPARTVVVSSTRKPTNFKSADEIGDGKRNLTINEFQQMAGRAGRRGIDVKGFVYTMSTNKDQQELFKGLVESGPNKLESHLNPDYSLVASYHDFSQDDDFINEFLTNSFAAFDEDPEISKEKAETLLKTYKTKSKVLKRFGYINQDNTLSPKGRLLMKLNGYQQIPIIDMVYNKKLPVQNPVMLASCAGTLATANENVAQRLEQDKVFNQKRSQQGGNKAKGNFESAKFKHENPALIAFVKAFDDYIKIYNTDMKNDPGFSNIAQNKSVPTHLYAWAKLNSTGKSSQDNWGKLLDDDRDKTIFDEGSLFKEITQTIDLLKQITEIADEGLKISATLADEDYYSALKENALNAIKLIQKEPVSETKH